MYNIKKVFESSNIRVVKEALENLIEIFSSVDSNKSVCNQKSCLICGAISDDYGKEPIHHDRCLVMIVRQRNKNEQCFHGIEITTDCMYCSSQD